MVPVKMCHQNVQLQVDAVKFVLQTRPELPRSCSCVDHDDLVAGAHLQAGGVASIAQMAWHGSRCGPTNTPELQSQRGSVPHDASSEEHTSELQSPCNLVC